MTAAPKTWNELLVGKWLGSARPAVIMHDLEWSGDELLHRAGGVAVWLDAQGYEPGAPVPAMIEESPAAVALVTGGALSGRPVAPLGTRLAPNELAAAVMALGHTGLVTTPDLLATASEVARIAGVPAHVLDEVPRAPELPSYRAAPDDVAVIVHTSGTTGAPKPVFVRHRALVERVGIYESAMSIGPGDRYCSASPFHHTAGVTMVFTVLGRGAAVMPQAWFSVDGWREAGRLGVTHALLVPTMIDVLLAAGALNDAHPRVLQYGAAPIDSGTLTDALAVLPDVEFLQIFGQTEVSPLTALTHADHVRGLRSRPELLSTVGRAVTGVELCVENPDDEGVGELAVRAPHAFTTDEDGWRRTGDLGRIDAEGYVRLHGRVNDRIVWGGENIYPIEVERALESHPAVREVAVVGVPDRRWGETVKAVVVPSDPSAPPTTEELQAHARQRLARFKVPSAVELVDELPRNANGKVMRSRLIGPGR